MAGLSKTLLRFSADNRFLSWLVRQRTGCEYSHVDFWLPDGSLLGALPGVGVVKRPVPKKERSLIYEVDTDSGHLYAMTQVGKPYDWLAIAGLAIPLPRPWQHPDRWYCSEIVATSLLQAGCSVVSTNSWGVTPRDLLLSPLLKRVG